MMADEGLRQMIREIEAQGYDHETAWRFAQLIGDTPITDENNHVIVMEHATGAELARLRPLKILGMQPRGSRKKNSTDAPRQHVFAEMTWEGFLELAREIESLGYDRETAAKYAAIIGDMPVGDGKGNTLVIDPETNQVLAQLAFGRKRKRSAKKKF